MARRSRLVPCLASLVLAAQLGTAWAQPSTQSARPSPDWVKDAVVYEVNPRAFSAAGSFKGVTARLDELKDLGVTVLWLMPMHPIGQLKRKGAVGSPYSVKDYYAIDRALGTKRDLKELTTQAQRRGMRVILDVVFNHTSWDNALLKKHPDFYTHDESGKIIPPDPGWTDVADLNYDNPKLRSYIIDVMKHWLREVNFDGYRCDVAHWVPTDFWEKVRDELQAIKPDLFLLAEADKPELLTKAFDVDYAWGFHYELDRVLHSMVPASKLRAIWESESARWPKGALRLRFSDNHDERRAIARFGERAALAASALVFTLDGVPLLYNGMEIGDGAESSAPALFERFPVAWQFDERRAWVRPFYKELIALRRDHPALRRGETRWLKTSDDSRVVSYVRRTPEEELLVAINLSSVPFLGTVDLKDAAGFKDVALKLPLPLLPGASKVELVQVKRTQLPKLELPAWGVRVLQRGSKGGR